MSGPGRGDGPLVDPVDCYGPGHAALAVALGKVRGQVRGSFPAVWSPLLRRLADRDELLLAELSRVEPALVAGRRWEGPAVLAAAEALDAEAGRAAELWRWVLEHWLVWS